jgi:hypothetical protein
VWDQYLLVLVPVLAAGFTLGRASQRRLLVVWVIAANVALLVGRQAFAADRVRGLMVLVASLGTVALSTWLVRAAQGKSSPSPVEGGVT